MLLTRLTGNSITVLSLAVAFVQLSAYGAALGFLLTSRPRRLAACAGILAAHFAGAIACYSGLLSNFS